MDWTQPADLRRQVQTLWDTGVLLACLAGEEGPFPKRMRLKVPSSRELTERFEEVRNWIASLQKGAYYRVEMRTIRHQIVGTNVIPKAAWIDCLEDAFALIEKQKEAKLFVEILHLIHSRRPGIVEWVKKCPLRVLALSEDWSRLLDIVDWVVSNPKPAIYLRQVDIPGIHSKFIENHRSILIALLDLILPQNAVNSRYQGSERFSLRYGFLEKPSRIRFRMLDPAFALLPGPDQDITVTQSAFRRFDTDERIRGKIRRIFITENEINFLAFPALSESIVIFGAGYGFDFLSDIPWIANHSVYYWGDIDTHGFAILDQLRAQLPRARSVLMDKETLLAHRLFWGNEERQETRDLHRLTQEERQLYDDLRNQRLSLNLRLEQERVGFKWAARILQEDTLTSPR